MYDYATQAKQNQIITLLNTTNTEISDLNNTLSQGFFSIFFIIVFIFLFFFIRSLLGGNRYE